MRGIGWSNAMGEMMTLIVAAMGPISEVQINLIATNIILSRKISINKSIEEEE